MPKDRERTEEKSEKPQSKGAGDMSVRDAGRLGGQKGGQRVKELIEEGKRAERGEEDR